MSVIEQTQVRLCLGTRVISDLGMCELDYVLGHE